MAIKCRYQIAVYIPNIHRIYHLLSFQGLPKFTQIYLKTYHLAILYRLSRYFSLLA
jgi:hypothetical protein